MYVNKMKESMARVSARKIGQDGDEKTIKAIYKTLGGLYIPDVVEKPKRKTLKKVVTKMAKKKSSKK